MAKAEQPTQTNPSERRKGFIFLGVSVVAFLIIIAAALWPQLNQPDQPTKSVGKLGATLAEAKCSPVEKSSAAGSGDHREDGTKLTYPQGPPASGPHWGNFLYGPQIRNFYTREDRPPVEQLVHSLEHGHTIIWYDETIQPGTPSYERLQTYAKGLTTSDYLMIAPWNADDGNGLPSGKHLALTHWTGPDDQQAVRQYCALPSGEAFDAFRKEFTNKNAPEPGAP